LHDDKALAMFRNIRIHEVPSKPAMLPETSRFLVLGSIVKKTDEKNGTKNDQKDAANSGPPR